jgi:hypothetical protein
MAYGLIIGEVVAQELATFDDVRHQLMLLEMLSLVDDPTKGVEMDRNGDLSYRMLGVGMLGIILYEVDFDAKVITVADVV